MPIELGSLSLGATAGTIVGLLCGHYLAKSRNTEDRKIKEFNQAAAEFRAAFIDYIYQVRHTESMTEFEAGFYGVGDNHIVAVSEQEKAKIRFEPFVDKSSRASFEAAWEKYRNWSKQTKKQKDKDDTKNTILTHMDALLMFAQFK